MKRYIGLILTSSAAIALSGCNGSPFDRYFEQSVALFSSRGTTMTGNLNFTEISYYTAYRQECDYRTVCDRYPVQTLEQTLGLPGPGHGGGGHVGGGDHGGGGHDGDHHGGGDGDHHGGGGWDHGGGGYYHPPGGGYYPQPRCWTEAYNCREVPYQDSVETTIPSQITATVTGAGDTSTIGSLTFEVHANSGYPQFVTNPDNWPNGSDAIFKGLTPSDQNLLVLKSKIYELVPGQDFLNLPENFKAGDPLEISVQVQPASNPKLGLSAVGNVVALPPLEFTRGR